MAIVEVATLPTTPNRSNPLDLWAGADGEGFDRSLFLSCGGRLGDGRGAELFRHDDRLGDGHWVSEFLDGALETANKLRDWTDAAGVRRLYAWVEGPAGGQSTLLRRVLGSPTWAFEAIPFSGNTVGGRGLGVNANQADDLYHGQTADWAAGENGVVRKKDRTTGAYSTSRTKADSLMWELEFEPPAVLWEFWNKSGPALTPAVFRAGVQVSDVPGQDATSAMWFARTGHIYVTINENNPKGQVARSADGAAWTTVLTFSQAVTADHVVAIPRGAGELWAVGHEPFQVYRTEDGTMWTDQGLPALTTGSDGNHLTALGYYGGRVWIAARDAGAGLIRLYREALPSTIQDLPVQVI